LLALGRAFRIDFGKGSRPAEMGCLGRWIGLKLMLLGKGCGQKFLALMERTGPARVDKQIAA